MASMMPVQSECWQIICYIYYAVPEYVTEYLHITREASLEMLYKIHLFRDYATFLAIYLTLS
jgi:hypothetical protein